MEEECDLLVPLKKDDDKEDTGSLHLHRRQAIRRRGFNWHIDQSPFGSGSGIVRRRPKSVPASSINTFQSRSSVDLTPSLLSMYDKLNTSTNGSLSNHSMYNSEKDLMGDNSVINPKDTNVKLLAQEEIRPHEMEDGVDSGGTHSVGMKRPLSFESTSSCSSSSIHSYNGHKRPNLEDQNKRQSKQTLQSLADSSYTSMDSLSMGDDWTRPNSQQSMENDPNYENVPMVSGALPVVKVYSPQNSTGSNEDASFNSSTISDERGDNSPTSQPIKSSTFSLKLNTNINKDTLLKSPESPTKKSGFHSPVLSKDATHFVSYAQRVASEIVETEKFYVHSLSEIIDGYMKHIYQCDSISTQEASRLFGNLEDIFAFNKELLAKLEKCDEDPVEIARCFVEKSEGFHIYTQYCTDYPASMEVLTNCMMQPQLAEMFKSWQAALGHGLPLGAYLLKPVQRILKYHLLLQNIVKYHEPDSPGHETLTKALDHMTHMAHHINEMKRRHEHAVRVQEVQSLLDDYDGPDLATLGELKLEGCFRLYGAKASRSVFLFEKGILLTKRKEDGMFSCKAVIECSNLMLVESVAKEPLSFHVIPFDNTKLQYTLQARSLEMKRKWCQEIKRLILESYKGKIPDKVKSLVMALGKTRDEEEEEMNVHNYNMGLDTEKKPRRKSANLMDLVKLKKGHRKNDATPPRLAPLEPSHQADIRNSSSRLQIKQTNKTISGSRSMDNLSIAGSHTLPRAKLPSNSDQNSNETSNKHDPSSEFDFVKSDADSNTQISRAKSFKIATRANPITSISVSDNEESSEELTSSDEEAGHEDYDNSRGELHDVYVKLMCNNNTMDHAEMLNGSRVSSMPILNDGLDEADYVTVSVKPEDDRPYPSSALNNAHSNSGFECLTAEDMIADNNLIYESIEHPKRHRTNSSSSTYENLNSSSSTYENLNSSSSTYENLDNRSNNNNDQQGNGSPVIPPPSQFADSKSKSKKTVPLKTNSDNNFTDSKTKSKKTVPLKTDSDNNFTDSKTKSEKTVPLKTDSDNNLSDPWIKQMEDVCKTVPQKAHRTLLGKSYSFPLGDVEDSKCRNQASFDWFVYSNKMASTLTEKFHKLKLLDKLSRSKVSLEPKYAGYVTERNGKDSYTLPQRKTIAKYGTPPRNALSPQMVRQFNCPGAKSDTVSIEHKRKDSKTSKKSNSALSTSQLWDRKLKQDKTKEKSKPTATSVEPHKMVAEMERYVERNSSLHSSTSSLNKFPSTSTINNEEIASDNKVQSKNTWPLQTANFMSKSRDSMSSSTSSLNKAHTSSTPADYTNSQDSFVGSLRNKLSHLTARLTARKQTPNINSTFNPPQGQYTATFNARYKTPIQPKPEGFVSHLAKIYNAREQTSPTRRVQTTPERIVNYATVLRNRQLGSPALGSRLATSTNPLPVRSLPRQQHNSTSDTETCQESLHDHHNENLVSNNVEQSDSAVSILSHESDRPRPPQRHNSTDSIHSTISNDSIYERRFSRTIEDPDDNVFRDSAVYSDMDTGYHFTAPKSLPATPRKSIREVVQLIEERSRPKQPEVLDVRRREPGRTIQEKLKSLQQSAQYHRRSHQLEEDLESRPLKDCRRSLGSSRSSVDRDEASYSIRYSRGFSSREDGVQMSKSTSGLDQIGNEVNTLVTMKGWVRQLINKFQTDQ